MASTWVSLTVFLPQKGGTLRLRYFLHPPPRRLHLEDAAERMECCKIKVLNEVVHTHPNYEWAHRKEPTTNGDLLPQLAWAEMRG